MTNINFLSNQQDLGSAYSHAVPCQGPAVGLIWDRSASADGIAELFSCFWQGPSGLGKIKLQCLGWITHGKNLLKTAAYALEDDEPE